MKNALKMDIKGLKCDNPDCDYVNMDIKVEDYKKWVNKPCPKCGENLLTEDDYNFVMIMLNITDKFNKIFPKVQDDEKLIEMDVNLNSKNGLEFNMRNLTKEEQESLYKGLNTISKDTGLRLFEQVKGKE